MKKLLPAMLALGLGIACTAAPAAGAQDPTAAAPHAMEVCANWAVMIVGFAGAGALLRHERRMRRAQVA